MKRKFLILICFVFIVSIAGVSAADDLNQTVDGDTLSVSQEIDDVLSNDEGFFSDLIVEIGDGGTRSLQKSIYRYDEGSTITISKSGTIDGNGAIIDMAGSSNMRIFDVQTSDVVFKNIVFKNAKEGAIYFNDFATLINCDFINNTYERYYSDYYNNGAALYLVKGGTFTNCNFINNTAEEYGGAAVLFSRTSVFLTNCNFTGNNAHEITYMSSGNGNFDNCNFVNNSGTIISYGGDNGTIDNCNFVNNSGMIIYYPSYGSNPTLNLINSNFSSNHAGICLLHIGGCGTIDNCNFINNSADEHGGAISIYNRVTVSNCDFVNNSAKNGGAISIEKQGSLINCRFTGNSAEKGGAIYMEYYDNNVFQHITNCSFVNNSADEGGAIASYAMNCHINNCNFTSNRANSKGGAFFTSGESSNGVDFSKCNFINNSASDGGAIYCAEDRTCAVNDCDFVNNSASDSGGAIFICSSSYWPVSHYVEYSRFINNSAIKIGGAVHMDSGDVLRCDVLRCDFINNTIKGDKIYYEGFFDYYGGAVSLGSGDILNCNFMGNAIESFDESYAEYIHAYGGAVSLGSGIVYNCDFINNSAKDNVVNIASGSVWVCDFISSQGTSLGIGSGDVKNSNFINGSGRAVSMGSGFVEESNFLNNLGGALSLNSGNVTKSYFENNIAGGVGGAIWMHSGIVDKCNFINNTATADNAKGGAIYIDEGTIKNSGFTGNKAKDIHGSGGAISFFKGGNVTDCDFINNSADNMYGYGGAIFFYYSESFGNISNCNFVNNSANMKETRGGAIHFNGNGKVTFSNFTNNSAQWCGGAISFDVSAIQNVSYCNFIGNEINEEGIICSRSTNTKIRDCNFISNVAGKYILSMGSSSLVNCNFTSNYCANIEYGKGMMHFVEGDIVNCNFLNNTMNEGNCIYFSTDGSVIDCSFIDNKLFDGGCVNFENNGSVLNCNFVNNSNKGEFKSAMISIISSGSVTNSNFTNNLGGAVSIHSGNVTDCSFIGNSAESGAAIYGGLGENSVSNCIFINNTATGLYDGYFEECYGGAVFFRGNACLTNSTFIENKAKGSYNAFGGAVYFNSACNLSNCNFTSNTATDKGGAVYCYGDNGVVEKCNFVENIAAEAGAVYWQGENAVSKNNNFNYYYSPGHNDYVISGKGLKINVLDVTMQYGSSGFLEITLTEDGSPVGGAVVGVDFNGAKDNVSLDDNGKARYELDSDTDSGVYDAVVSYKEVSATAKVTINPLDTIIVLSYSKESHDSVTLTAFIDPLSIDCGNVIFKVNGEDYVSDIHGGEANYTLEDLDIGNYTVQAFYTGDINYINSSSGIRTFEIGESSYILEASEVTEYYGAFEEFTVELYDDEDYSISDADIKVTVDGETFTITTDEDGEASFVIDLAVGSYDVMLEYENAKITSKITVESTILAADARGSYGNTTFEATFLDTDGDALINCEVQFSVNAKTYKATTDSDGVASVKVDLNPGEYEITSINPINDEKTTNNLEISKANSSISISQAMATEGIVLSGKVIPSTATGKVIFIVNNTDYPVDVKNGVASITVPDLAAGTYNATAKYSGDSNYNPSESEITFTVSDYYVIITAPDVEKYFKGPERFVVTLVDNKGNPVTNTSVSININGNNYTRVTDDNGIASMAINLNSGIYTVTTRYNSSEVLSTVTIKSTVSGENITKMFRNGTQYYATFYDTKGNTLANNAAVEFNINGVFYTRYTNEKGVARMNINLNPGEYVITAKNPNSTEQYTNIITVLPTIVENYDLTKYYKNASQYSLRLLDEKGNPVKAGVNVKLNINGVFYTRTSNDDGYVKMNINLEPGEYTITAEYNGLMASNKIKVLSVIETHDLVMKYKDGSKFEAKILDGQGKAYPAQKVTFNINGVFYERFTGDDGIARLNINLMAGEYIITTSYNGMNAANKVTISS